MERPACKTCPYWDQDQDQQGMPDPEEPFGECRKHAPSLFTGSEQVEYEADIVYWPRVFNADWCGEHPDFPAYIASLKPSSTIPEMENQITELQDKIAIATYEGIKELGLHEPPLAMRLELPRGDKSESR